MAEVCRHGDNTLNSIKVLIAFVPGIMGSRLHFVNGHFWDPDDTRMWRGRMVYWYLAPLSETAATLHFESPASVSPPPDNVDSVVELSQEETKRGFGSVVWSHYGDFLRSYSIYYSNYENINTVLYAFGFDWRQSNAVSGADLSQRIKKAADDENADGVIIVTHSQGGLAIRSALKQDSILSDRVWGVIHVFQPAAGAVLLYRRFYTGMVKNFDSDNPKECVVFGNTGEKFATMVSGLPGAMELLPTTNYTDSGSHAWLEYTHHAQSVATGGALIYDAYRFSSQKWPPASLAKESWATGSVPCTGKPPALYGEPNINYAYSDVLTARELGSRVDEAQAFHQKLGLFKHPSTFSIVGTECPTEVRFLSNPKNVISFENRPQYRHEGDGTVPASSASVLFPGEVFNFSDRDNLEAHQFVVVGIAHEDAFSSGSDVRGYIRVLIRRMLGFSPFK